MVTGSCWKNALKQRELGLLATVHNLTLKTLDPTGSLRVKKR